MSTSDIQRILAGRVLSRRRLIPFVEHMNNDYQAGWVHHDIAYRLERFYQQVKEGKSPRLMLNCPPRSGKSMLASTYFPAWIYGQDPQTDVILTSYNLDLPLAFSRKIRAMLRDDPEYRALFPGTTLSTDSQSAETWMTGEGGTLVAAGIGGGLTGRGAHILIIDDNIKNSEEADNQQLHEKQLDWFQSTAYTRLAPGGGVLIIACMTGDTPVLRPDGGETPLKDIRQGDLVVSYDEGRAVIRPVVNHQSNGHDSCFEITTTYGTIVRANERHPFLVQTPGGTQWKKLKELKPGDSLVRRRGATDQQERRLSRGCATDANPKSPTTGSTPTRRCATLGIGESTRVKHAPLMGVGNTQYAKVCVQGTTRHNGGLLGTIANRLRNAAVAVLNTAMGLMWRNTTACLSPKKAFVQSVELPQIVGVISHTTSGSALITATPEMSKVKSTCVGCSVTHAISPLDTLKHQKTPCEWLSTCEFTADPILSIEYCGEHEVFDLQIDGTENYIANGLVSHNTRWNYHDLSGRLQQLRLVDPEADNYELVDYPAIATTYEYRHRSTFDMLRADEPLDLAAPENADLELLRKPKEALHPQRFGLTLLNRIKANLSPRIWSALYQQRPVPDEGLFFQKGYIQPLAELPVLPSLTVYTAFDFAIGQKAQNDYTVGSTALQDPDGRLFVDNIVRQKRDTYGIVNMILEEVQRVQRAYPTSMHYVGFEDGVIFKAVEPVLKREMRKRRIFFTYELLTPLTDKNVRARPLQSLMEQGMVYFWTRIPCYDEVMTELLQFPAGKHDDIVDSLSWTARLSLAHEPPKPVVYQQHSREKSWKVRLLGLGGGNRTYLSA